MSFSAVGTVIKPTVASTTFTLVPAGVGDFIVIGVLVGFPSSSTTSWATALTSAGGNVTWSVLVGHTAFSTQAGEQTLFIGKVVTAASHVVTISFNTGTPAVRVAGQEFSNTAGFAAVTLDASGTVDTASSGHYATVTPTKGAGELYWGYCWDSVTAVAGGSSGYVYQNDASGNGTAYNLSCANATQTPLTGNSDGLSGLGVLLYEAATTPALADTAASSAGTLSVGASVPLGDTAGAADALAVSVTLPLADTAGASESLASGSPVGVADTAAAADALAVTVAVPLSDTAAAADAVANLTPFPSDTAAAADKVTIGSAFGVADTAAAADALTVSAAVPLKDTAAAADARTVPSVTVALNDTAAASEATVTATGGPPTLGGILPGNVGSQVNPPGYQGGPSGAGAVVPSALGNSWEIYAYSGTDYTTLLAVIPASMLLSFQFARQLDDIGSGTVVLSQDDPWWEAVTLPGGLPTETLLDEECMWQFRKDGVPRFEFLGETVTEQLVDPSEQRQVTITGPGTIAALKWAMIAPQGFPDIVLKLDGILDSFDEVNSLGQGVVDTNIWTTVTPASHVYITPIANIYSYPGGVGYNLGTLFPSGSLTIGASPSTTYLGASPYDATDTLISAQVTPIGVTANAADSTTPAAYGTGLNGSELTQFYIQSNFNSANYALFGLSGSAFYVQAGSGGSVSTKILPAYDSTAHAYWMITEQAGSGGGSGTFYFWTSPDGQAWTQQWTYIHHWNATDVSFFVSATYSVDATQSVQITNLNSNVTTPSYQGALYLGVPLMGVWLDQFSQAQARGTVPFITSLATATGDTYGRAWPDVQNVQAVNGTDLYSFLQSATAVVNADYVMDPGFQLRVGQPAAGQVALGVDRSGYLVLREGYDTAAKQRVRARNAIETLIAGENADGHEISASSPAFIAEWGQREGWFQAAVQIDPTSMAYASAAALAQNETEVLSWTFTLVPNLPGKTVFDNFDVGDWLGLERPNFSAVDPVRVMGIAVSVDSTGAETHELTFVSYIQWLAEQLTYLSNKLGGAFVNSLGTSPVAPSKYGTGQVPTYFTPAATLAGLADVAPAAGSAIAHAPLVYNPNTGQYQHAGTADPVTGNTVPLVVATPTGTAVVAPTLVTVNSGGATSTVGLQGDGTVTQVDTGGAVPATPDTPLVTGTVQGVNITWDGLLAGAAPLSNFQYIQFHVSTVSGFTPSATTLLHTQPGQASIALTGLAVGTTYYAKLVAVSTSGAASAASAQASAVAGATVPGVVDNTVITGGTIVADGSSGEILVYSSSPTTGDLILSVSAVAGTDAYTNPYVSGLGLYSTGGSSMRLSDNGTAAVIEGFSGAATEVSPATLFMAVSSQGLANENIQMQLRGPESSHDSASVTIILSSSAADGSSTYGGTLEVNASSAAGWGPGSLGTQFNITHQLLIGGATGGSQVEMSGDIHVGGNIIIGSGSFPVAAPSTAGAVAAQGTWSTAQQAWAASVTAVVNNLRTQLLAAGILV